MKTIKADFLLKFNKNKSKFRFVFSRIRKAPSKDEFARGFRGIRRKK